MDDQEEQDARISAVLGDRWAELAFDDCVSTFFDHLVKSLKLPCEVTGVEDFQWEEFYIIGPGSRKEHTILRKTQPSFKDVYDLLKIERGVDSEWMMFQCEDLAALVRRTSDGKEFYLGMAEIKATDEKSINYQLLDDYAVWFMNNR